MASDDIKMNQVMKDSISAQGQYGGVSAEERSGRGHELIGAETDEHRVDV